MWVSNLSAYPITQTPMQDYTQAAKQQAGYQPFQQYCLTGNCYTILTQSRDAELPKDAHTVKIAVSGTVTRSFNVCCFAWTIVAVVIFVFPLFLFFCEAWKRKVYMLYRINTQVYQAIARIITTIRPRQVTLIVEDQYFNAEKSQILKDALPGVVYFQFKNQTLGVDTCGSNYQNFDQNMAKIMMIVERVDCRWDRKLISTVPL